MALKALCLAVVKSKDKSTYAQAVLDLRLWFIKNDPWRPLYHFPGIESWINGPNGPNYHEGKYHLFYQYDPIVDGRRSKRCWGHAVSEDLVHGGATEGKKQGAAWLWRSADLQSWKLQRNIAPSIQHGRGYWEMPYPVPLDGRHVLMVGAGNPYWIGDDDAEAMEFTPRTPVRSVDSGHYYSFNPHMVDDKGENGSERRLMHGWATMGRPPAIQGVPYWEQAHSIPRVITIKDDRLWQEPIPELQSLRYDKQTLERQTLPADNPVRLTSVRGDALELVATLDRSPAKRCGLTVRANDRGEGTKIWVGADNAFGIEGRRHTYFLNNGAPLVLHVFVDRGVLEVYCDGVAVTHKCSASADRIGVFAFSEGGDAILKALEAWEMNSMWEQCRTRAFTTACCRP